MSLEPPRPSGKANSSNRPGMSSSSRTGGALSTSAFPVGRVEPSVQRGQIRIERGAGFDRCRPRRARCRIRVRRVAHRDRPSRRRRRTRRAWPRSSGKSRSCRSRDVSLLTGKGVTGSSFELAGKAVSPEISSAPARTSIRPFPNARGDDAHRLRSGEADASAGDGAAVAIASDAKTSRADRLAPAGGRRAARERVRGKRCSSPIFKRLGSFARVAPCPPRAGLDRSPGPLSPPGVSGSPRVGSPPVGGVVATTRSAICAPRSRQVTPAFNVAVPIRRP